MCFIKVHILYVFISFIDFLSDNSKKTKEYLFDYFLLSNFEPEIGSVTYEVTEKFRQKINDTCTRRSFRARTIDLAVKNKKI